MAHIGTNRLRIQDQQAIKAPYQEEGLLESQLKVFNVSDVVEPPIWTFSLFVMNGRWSLLRGIVNRLPRST